MTGSSTDDRYISSLASGARRGRGGSRWPLMHRWSEGGSKGASGYRVERRVSVAFKSQVSQTSASVLTKSNASSRVELSVCRRKNSRVASAADTSFVPQAGRDGVHRYVHTMEALVIPPQVSIHSAHEGEPGYSKLGQPLRSPLQSAYFSTVHSVVQSIIRGLLCM